MPKYVYQNINTGEQYEFEQRFSEDSYTHHPETGEPIKRIIFAPAVVFKGSGWYAKDSKAASSKSPAKSETASETKTESEPKAESESKPAPSKAETPAASSGSSE